MTDGKSQQEPTMEEILASIRRIISEDGEEPAKPAQPAKPAAAAPQAAAPPPPPPPPPAEPEEAGAEDVLELTQMVKDDGSVVDLSAEPAAAPEPPPRPSSPRADDEGWVSPTAAEAASASFADLAGALNASRGIPLGAGQRTIEELVKEMLRPMLKQWLDSNLPSLVQRVVEREVAKLAGRAEDNRRR